MSQPAVVDSSVWIELVTQGKRHAQCKRAIENAREIIVPTIVIFEVYKKIATQLSEQDALEVVGEMSRHHVVDLDRSVALLAGDIAREAKLGMADSVVLAHARAAGVTLLTMDNDFARIADARVIR